MFRNPNRFSDVIVSEEPNKIESGIVNAILNDKEIKFPDDNEFLIFVDTTVKIKEDDINKKKKTRLKKLMKEMFKPNMTIDPSR